MRVYTQHAIQSSSVVSRGDTLSQLLSATTKYYKTQKDLDLLVLESMCWEKLRVLFVQQVKAESHATYFPRHSSPVDGHLCRRCYTSRRFRNFGTLCWVLRTSHCARARHFSTPVIRKRATIIPSLACALQVQSVSISGTFTVFAVVELCASILIPVPGVQTSHARGETSTIYPLTSCANRWRSSSFSFFKARSWWRKPGSSVDSRIAQLRFAEHEYK